MYTVSLPHLKQKSEDTEEETSRPSLVVQRLRLWPMQGAWMGLIPGLGTKIPHALLHSQKIKIKFKTF